MTRILLVDDELAILLTLKAILELNGYEVATAASSAEAMLILGAETFDLVISDLKMEHERSGFDVVRFAREQSYCPAVAILTACPDFGRDWKEQGADSLLIKPMNPPELLDSIEELLGRQQIRTWREKKTSIVVKPSEATAAYGRQPFVLGVLKEIVPEVIGCVSLPHFGAIFRNSGIVSEWNGRGDRRVLVWRKTFCNLRLKVQISAKYLDFPQPADKQHEINPASSYITPPGTHDRHLFWLYFRAPLRSLPRCVLVV